MDAGLVVPVVIVPDKEIAPVWLLVPRTKPANLPPLPKIESLPSKMLEVMVNV